MEKAIAPALLQIPVVEIGQENLVVGVGDYAVSFVLASGDGCELSVNDSGIMRCEIVNCDDDFTNQVVALFSEVEVVSA